MNLDYYINLTKLHHPLFKISPVEEDFTFCSAELQEHFDFEDNGDYCDNCPFWTHDHHERCAASSEHPAYSHILDYVKTNHPESLL